MSHYLQPLYAYPVRNVDIYPCLTTSRSYVPTFGSYRNLPSWHNPSCVNRMKFHRFRYNEQPLIHYFKKYNYINNITTDYRPRSQFQGMAEIKTRYHSYPEPYQPYATNYMF
ncbi:unnamed protein product [Bursaphelenchus xylophilus]|uniref:(pine wood nematode) hypothetical protein n=1 Tax=Bursaphelenchus xylophilus TaxID=6326 RepID=A0A1I7STB3_BURXY|nr:unnamed protein product [Bursaphelenchus xylophilus]CAG9108595.1 unnamed protein product [Bursaphelenchus xylophilus]